MTAVHLKEPFFVRPEDDDEGLVRPYWMAYRCPKNCDCSIKSWNQVQKVSYRGAHVVRQRVLDHLVQSPGQHEMFDQEAEELCNTDLVISKWDETYADRQITRKMVMKKAAEKAAEEAFDKVKKEAEEAEEAEAEERQWAEVQTKAGKRAGNKATVKAKPRRLQRRPEEAGAKSAVSSGLPSRTR